MTDAHAEFLENPEAHASHLETCGECRAMIAGLERPLTSKPLRLEDLPLAGWEGAGHRPWGLVVTCGAILLVVALALCNAAGISPIRAVTMDGSLSQWRTMFNLLSGALRGAAIGWQIVVIAAFVIVNTILFLLLRRAPRGIDA